MRKFFGSRQLPGLVIGILALVIAAAGGALAASSGGSKKITVCVSKSGGTLYQAKKCKKGEKKLSWNQTGPQGPAGANGKNGANGTNGTNGANGANGAVSGYSAVKSSSVDITNETNFETIVSKALPAGNYIVSGQAVLSALDTSSPGQATDDSCRLIAGSTESLPVTWSSPLGGVFIFRLAEGSVSMQMPLSLSGTTTVALQCKNLLNSPPATWTNLVDNASITAIQTTTNS